MENIAPSWFTLTYLRYFVERHDFFHLFIILIFISKDPSILIASQISNSTF